jgi:hypothetical protein
LEFQHAGKKKSKKRNPDNIARMEMYSRMRDEYRKFFPPLKELPYVDVEGEQRLAWAKEESLEEMNEPPATDAEEAEDASSPFSKDDYMKMAETGSGTDPAGVVFERSTEQSRMKKIRGTGSQLYRSRADFVENLKVSS